MKEGRKGVIEGRKEGRKERNEKMRKKNASTLTDKILTQK